MALTLGALQTDLPNLMDVLIENPADSALASTLDVTPASLTAAFPAALLQLVADDVCHFSVQQTSDPATNPEDAVWIYPLGGMAECQLAIGARIGRGDADACSLRVWRHSLIAGA